MDKNINDIVSNILQDYEDDRVINQIELFDQPDTAVIYDVMDKLLKVIFPGFVYERSYRFYNMSSQLTVIIEDVMYNLTKQIVIAMKQLPPEKLEGIDDVQTHAEKVSQVFFASIPKVRALVETDVQAIFDGDPAAFNKNEIILCYPGLYAIVINRLAHELYRLGVPLIPRIMTEQAHSQTGIDIHPGATLGEYFMIDHGTGIVIGETTIIGNHVKIYQGVTLGGLSTRGGQALKNVRRHPTIEDNVTIYSGASILGGETVIGEGCVIGANVFITESVAPGTRVSVRLDDINQCRQKF